MHLFIFKPKKKKKQVQLNQSQEAVELTEQGIFEFIETVGGATKVDMIKHFYAQDQLLQLHTMLEALQEYGMIYKNQLDDVYYKL
jgi:hypothetical protein